MVLFLTRGWKLVLGRRVKKILDMTVVCGLTKGHSASRDLCYGCGIKISQGVGRHKERKVETGPSGAVGKKLRNSSERYGELGACSFMACV